LISWETLSLVVIAAHFAGSAAMTWLAHITGVFAIAFSLLSLGASLWLFRKRSAVVDDSLAPVTIMKPLKGEDHELYENLASFCAQDYPCFQVIFCVDNPQDPSLRVVERLRKDFPALDIEAVISRNKIGCNPKINNLANAYSKAKHDTLLISDSDIRVGRDFLRRSVPAFQDPKVGLVTCFYRAANAKGLWGKLEALSINAQFLPQAVTAGAFGMRFAMGAAILLRRSAFDAIGGFKSLADHIADDYSLGVAVQAAGYRVEFSELVVDSITESWSASDMIRHQIREFRTIRICQPAGYFGTFLLHGFSLLTLKMALFGVDPNSLRLLLLLLAVKSFSIFWIHRVGLKSREPQWPLLLLPLSEWLSFACWLSGFGSSQVLWRGQMYSIAPNGRLIHAER